MTFAKILDSGEQLSFKGYSMAALQVISSEQARFPHSLPISPLVVFIRFQNPGPVKYIAFERLLMPH